LIGGETAEMPGMYPAGEYDLAGFAVGVVEKNQIVDGSTIGEGDVVLGLASSGAHSNGYSLIRKIIGTRRDDLTQELAGSTLGDALLAPTRIYVKAILQLLAKLPVKGLAHITGGGLTENVPRIMPERLTACMERKAWPLTPLFAWLQRAGNVSDDEMLRVFNCGIGMVVIVGQEHAQAAIATLQATGETVWRIGAVHERKGNEPQAIVT
jgi:phosphoribosylformylglycinamidine cyclo-ligase